jgi:hypothetical protein
MTKYNCYHHNGQVQVVARTPAQARYQAGLKLKVNPYRLDEVKVVAQV